MVGQEETLNSLQNCYLERLEQNWSFKSCPSGQDFMIRVYVYWERSRDCAHLGLL